MYTLIPTGYRALLNSAVSGTDHRIHTTKKTRVANLHTNPKPLASELAWKLTDVEGGKFRMTPSILPHVSHINSAKRVFLRLVHNCSADLDHQSKRSVAPPSPHSRT